MCLAANNGLVGTIPSELFVLQQLTRVSLAENALSGSIPGVVLSNWSRLEKLDLISNRFNMTIPQEVYGLSSLRLLALGRNSVHGTISSAMSQLSKLTSLDVSSGSVMASQLDVSFNDLTGTVPPAMLTGLTQLQTLSMRNNALSGTIPTEVGAMDQLQFLFAQSNLMVGTIPSEMGSLSSLTALQLNFVNLTGTLPTELGNLDKLFRLNVHLTRLSGTVPQEFARMTTLERLAMENTQLVGNVSFLCETLPRLSIFRVDLQDMECSCCQCCNA